jgi:DNA-binding NtrC family response regulator
MIPARRVGGGETLLFLEARVGGRVVRWPLGERPVVVGRDASACDIVIDDRTLSRRHLRLEPGPRSVVVEDLASTNGVWLDGKRIDRTEIGPEVWFAAGTVLLTVREGVSLTSGDAFPRPTPGVPGLIPSGTDPATLRPPLAPSVDVTGGDRDWLDGLAAELEAADAPESMLERLLEGLARHAGVESAALVEPHGNGWSLRALAGPALPSDTDEILQHLDGERIVAGAALFLPVASGRGYVALHPWGQGEPDALLRSLVALAGGLALPPERQRDEKAIPREAGGAADADAGGAIVATSAALLDLLRELDRLAATGLPILLQGESGTGKELLARRLHAVSGRHQGPFVALNCSAIPPDLIESELFGIEKGVATGVTARSGRFVLASGGTLFLDEIGDLPLPLQPKILRALETGEITPLGAPSAIPIDVRLVSATNQDLERLTADGRFRADLRYRLAGSVVRVPPLRDRPEDILPLARAFAREASRAQGRACRGLDLETARLLLGYPWPGNVRELRHAVTRAVALSDGPILHRGLFPSEIAANADQKRGDALLGLSEDFREAKARFERLYFSQLLERCDGNLTEAARVAGLSRSFLYEKLDELGLR